MGVKKSELYSSIWASCDELRGGMDASQYKDFVLVLLFVKYISDKYANVPYAPITVPAGSSFKDMVQLKGKPTIGDDINKKIIGPIAFANKISDVPDFNDATKLGSGKEMVDRLTKLIAIFENPSLDFSRNRADGDDILGDAYEFLMRHFATESGKSKGQFYTPAEVSRVIAKVIGISPKNTTTLTSVYDPTCGSGSLLLKIAGEAGKNISLFGQEMDNSTAALARMNMILHNNPTAEIKQGNTIANPLFLDEQNRLRTFDYVVANPPFSYKSWSSGIDSVNDPYGRFKDYGAPPEKNGDYAFLLHIIRSLKSNGKAAVILPHGVLFRGNAEAEIRRKLIQKGYIKAIIGLPANLFYGTGIPACIIVIDKENAEHRKGIFMIDAGTGYIKDGNKNRLREQDIHRIVDVFKRGEQIPGYSRMIPMSEIADTKNEYNLNIPRYIESTETDDIQDIEAHLLGGIPNTDIEAFHEYWKVFPSVKKKLFAPFTRPNYSRLLVEKEEVKKLILRDDDYKNFLSEVTITFTAWKQNTSTYLRTLTQDCHPKEVIHEVSEGLLQAFAGQALLDRYDLYQHLMNYWDETMKDDCYIIVEDGWKAEVYRIVVENKKGTKVDKGWACDLVPSYLVLDYYFSAEKKRLEEMDATRETLIAALDQLEEEHSCEEGYFADMEKVNKLAVQKRLKEISSRSSKVKETGKQGLISQEEESFGSKTEKEVMEEYLSIADQINDLAAEIKTANATLDKIVLAKYDSLTEEETKELVVKGKWMSSIDTFFNEEMERITHTLTQRIKELADRYESTLTQINHELSDLEKKVSAHLLKMGLQWN
jgi:type I restriction enzyme M protein